MGMVMVLHYKGRVWYRQGTSINFFKTRYKYGIGIKIQSPDIGGVYLTQGIIIADLAFNYLNQFTQSKLIHMATCIFIIITNIVGTYPHIQVMLLPKREHLITATFFLIIIGCQTLKTPTQAKHAIRSDGFKPGIFEDILCQV